MTFPIRLICSVALLGALGACSSGSSRAPSPFANEAATLAEFSTALSAHVARTQTVVGNSNIGAPGLPGTANSAMPTTGAATFTGSSSSIIPRAGADTIYVLGDADVTANFASNTMSGTVTNMSAATTSATGTPETPLLTQGTLALSTASSNNFATNLIGMDYNGTLIIDNVIYQMDGTLNGNFRSQAGASQPITAFAATDVANPTNSSTGTVNITTVVIGERQ